MVHGAVVGNFWFTYLSMDNFSACSELHCVWQYSGNLDYFTGLKPAFMVAKFQQKV